MNCFNLKTVKTVTTLFQNARHFGSSRLLSYHLFYYHYPCSDVSIMLVLFYFYVVQLLWDAHDSEKGPEGWARYVKMLPTHWYVYSLGSTVEYSFSNVEKKLHRRGSAFGHVEKNWGLTFPAGHVWLQAFSSDNTAQVLLLFHCVFRLLSHPERRKRRIKLPHLTSPKFSPKSLELVADSRVFSAFGKPMFKSPY